MSRVATAYYLTGPTSKKEKYEACKQTGKYDPYTRKKAGKKNCVLEQ